MKLYNIDKSIEILVYPEYGLTIQSMIINGISVIEGYENEQDMKQYKGYRQTFMIPFCGRIADGTFLYQNEVYPLKINRAKENCTIHGLLYNKSFQFISEVRSNNTVIYAFKYVYNQTDEGFPFAFSTNIEFHLMQNECEIKIQVENLSERNMPLQIGWHPYFTLGETIDEYELKMDENMEIKLNERKMASGETVFNERYKEAEIIANTTFDNCFHYLKNGKNKTIITHRKNNMSLEISQENMPYVQLYNPPTRSSIAIEPMSGSVSCFENGNGLIHLSPTHKVNVSFGVKLI